MSELSSQPPPPPIRTHRGYPYLPDFWEYYTRLPAIYDRFALSTDLGARHLRRDYDFTGKDVLDVAAGTGRSAFAMARVARRVVGVEPELGMRGFALERLARAGIHNVEFLDGSTSAMPPLSPQSFDLATSFHGPPFFTYADDAADRQRFAQLLSTLSRYVRRDGAIAFVMATPGWRHPYLESAPADLPGPSYDPHRRMEAALVESGFTFTDALLEVDYGTLDEALATYGYIYGPHAIDWLLARQSATVPWGNRVYLRVE